MAYDDPTVPSAAANLAVADTSSCIVTNLACEAAAVLRLKLRLDPDDTAADHDLIDALESPDDYLRPEEMRRALHERLRAIEHLASHRRPTSTKGALFQLYLAANAAQCTMGMLRTKLQAGETLAVERNERKMLQLHHAAIAILEQQAWDDDLEALRAWYLPQIYDVVAACERALLDRDGLIADASARPRTVPETQT